MINSKKIVVVFGVFVISSFFPQEHFVLAAPNGNLEVRFNGIKNSKGQVCFNLFNGPNGFPDGKQRANLKEARCIPIAQGTAKITLTGLPYGNYAVAAVHDTNGDTRLNSNFLGIPKEGFGFSNNTRVRTGPPSFVQSQFLVSGPNTAIQIKMQYF